QVFQVNAGLAAEGREGGEEQREADHRAGLLGEQDLGVRPRAEEIFAQTVFLEDDRVRQSFVLGQGADQAADGRRVGGGGGPDHGGVVLTLVFVGFTRGACRAATPAPLG